MLNVKMNTFHTPAQILLKLKIYYRKVLELIVLGKLRSKKTTKKE